MYTAYLPNIWVLALLAISQGLAGIMRKCFCPNLFHIFVLGMAFGLFLSAVCSTENAAVQTAIAVFYPNMLLSGEYHEPLQSTPHPLRFTVITLMWCPGVLWPLEGMPEWLRYISYSLPSTFPAEAMRAIMGRGKLQYHCPC